MAGERFRLLAVSGLGSGLLPGAPGTWGSALATLAWAGCAWWLRPCWLGWITLGGVLAASVVCVLWGPWAIRRTGGADPDPSFVVIDEWAGQWVALLPFSFGPFGVQAYRDCPFYLAIIGIVQFVLFRLLDIIKPPPCRRLERLPAGWGILADDLLAGAYAALVGACLVFLYVWSLATGLLDFLNPTHPPH